MRERSYLEEEQEEEEVKLTSSTGGLPQ
ncbi:unnamed protein product [Spirodela intermedia]|uniref:Uncharacterized protein n=1 Tax=Spirodela intermedia TaxID=51605 RepID=A0ABN7ECD4_SPIIN|nr:unnamed protein product [Spirodela intermedia]